jgi:hypothetical protein
MSDIANAPYEMGLHCVILLPSTLHEGPARTLNVANGGADPCSRDLDRTAPRHDARVHKFGDIAARSNGD